MRRMFISAIAGLIALAMPARAEVDAQARGLALASRQAATAATAAATDAVNSIWSAGGTRMFASQSDALANGVQDAAIIAPGASGANGTFALAFSGGSCSKTPVGSFVVSEGSVVKVSIRFPGVCAGTPTISTSASSGLSGASIAVVMGPNAPNNSYFGVTGATSDVAHTLFSVDGSGVASAVRDYPSFTALTSILTRTIGQTNVIAGTTPAGAGFPIIAGTMPIDGRAVSVRLDATVAGTGTIYAIDGTTSVSGSPVALCTITVPSAGLQTVSLKGCAATTAGKQLAIQFPGLSVIRSTSGGSFRFINSTNDPPVNGATISTQANLTLQLQVTVSGDMQAQVTTNASDIAGLTATVGGTQTIGGAPTSGGTPLATLALRGWSDVVSTDMKGLRAEIFADQPTTFNFYAVTRVAGTITAINSRVATFAHPGTGALTFTDPEFTALAGQNVGFTFIGSGFRYQSGAVSTFFGPANATPAIGQSTTTTSGFVYPIRVTLGSGLVGAQLMASAGATDYAGISALALADPTGVADAATIIRNSQTAQPYVFVRNGAFTSSLPPLYRGAGLYGPGEVYAGGCWYPHYSSMSPTALVDDARGALASQIVAGLPLIWADASVGHWAYASAGPKHFLNMLACGLNQEDTTGDQPLFTNFNNFGSGGSAYTPAFYGVTLSGFSSAAAGPVPGNDAGSMAAGGYIEFTGAFACVDVYYNGANTTLQWAYNGTPYRTLTLSAAGNDNWTGTGGACTATGQSASGTYRITNTGSNPVVITGLERFGVFTGPRPRLRVVRAAKGSQDTVNWTSANIDSALRIARRGAGSGSPAIAIMLGYAGSWSTPPGTVYTRLTALIDTLVAKGVRARDIYIIGHYRVAENFVPYTGGGSFDTFIEEQMRAAQDKGTRFIDLRGLPLLSRGGLADGGHLNDNGEVDFARAVAEGFARAR